MASFLGYGLEEMKELLDLGATWLEHVFNDTTRHVSRLLPLDRLFAGIKEGGGEHCIMSSDSGRWRNPIPVQQMGIYISEALNFGLDPAEIRKMVQDNPATLLGLD